MIKSFFVFFFLILKHFVKSKPFFEFFCRVSKKNSLYNGICSDIRLIVQKEFFCQCGSSFSTNTCSENVDVASCPVMGNDKKIADGMLYFIKTENVYIYISIFISSYLSLCLFIYLSLPVFSYLSTYLILFIPAYFPFSLFIFF